MAFTVDFCPFEGLEALGASGCGVPVELERFSVEKRVVRDRLLLRDSLTIFSISYMSSLYKKLQ